MRPSTIRLLLVTVAAVALVVPVGSASAAFPTRTWVSGIGDDANPCSRTAPCKTWAGAIAKTEAGGIIDALDPGAFGPVTITKSITLDGGGFIASSLAIAGTNAITVSAAAGDRVVLRGLELASNRKASPGFNGLAIESPATVLVDGGSIHGFSGQGVMVSPTTGSADVTIRDTVITDNAGAGIMLLPGAAGTVHGAARGVTITACGTGVATGAGAAIQLIDSTIVGNDYGLEEGVPGRIIRSGTNVIKWNTVDLELASSLSAPPYSAKVGKGFRFKFVVNKPVTALVEIFKGAKKIWSSSIKSGAGSGSILWNGKVGKTVQPAGDYTVRFMVNDQSGTVMGYYPGALKIVK